MIEVKERVIAERDDVVKQLQEQLGEQSKLMEQMQQSLTAAGEGEGAGDKEDAQVNVLIPKHAFLFFPDLEPLFKIMINK